MLPAGLLAHKVRGSSVVVGDPQCVPATSMGTSGLGRATIGPGTRDRDKVMSPHSADTEPPPADALVSWHFEFPASHSVEKLQLCQPLGEREG